MYTVTVVHYDGNDVNIGPFDLETARSEAKRSFHLYGNYTARVQGPDVNGCYGAEDSSPSFGKGDSRYQPMTDREFLEKSMPLRSSMNDEKSSFDERAQAKREFRILREKYLQDNPVITGDFYYIDEQVKEAENHGFFE